MGIGENIKEKRKQNGLTQKQLAEILGVSTITIQNYENNRRKPNVVMINAIADALDVSQHELMTGKSLFSGTGGLENTLKELIANNKDIKLSDKFNISDETKKNIDNILINSFLNFTTCIGLNDFKKLPQKNLLNIINSKTLTDLLLSLLEIERINLFIALKKNSELPKKEKQIWEEPGKEHLMPIASHDKDGEFTEEEYKHDDDLMNNDHLWK